MKKIYHGGCHGCNPPNEEYCTKCQYYECDWSLPNRHTSNKKEYILNESSLLLIMHDVYEMAIDDCIRKEYHVKLKERFMKIIQDNT